jgi:transcriptional regulator GlxA family with amidase domain
VFQDTELPAIPPDTSKRQPFELYTVSAKQSSVTSSGGARVTPKYTFETAPQADIVMIGAQSDVSPALLTWLRKQHAGDATLAAVCVGARQLALTGLLDGKQATTHHNYVSKLSKMYPKVAWQPGQRFVRSDTRLYTAGGLTSGIDLALHLVAERFGDAAALATAEEMEYRSDAWKR